MKEGGWTAEGKYGGGQSMVLPSPDSVLSPANLYEELKTKYPKFFVTWMCSVMVKLPLYTPWGHMGGSGRMAPYVNLGTGKRCVVNFAHCPPYLPPHGSHCIVGWIGSRASPDASEKRKISYHCRESNHVVSSIVSIPTELSSSPIWRADPISLRYSDAMPSATPDNSFM